MQEKAGWDKITAASTRTRTETTATTTINNSEARVGSTVADGSVVVIVAISNGNERNGRNRPFKTEQ